MCACVQRAMQNAFERSRSHAEVQLGACNHAAHIHTKVLLCTSQGGNVIARAWQTEIKNKLVKRVSVKTKKKNAKKKQMQKQQRRQCEEAHEECSCVLQIFGRCSVGHPF